MYCKVCKSRVLLIYSRVPDMVGARGGESNQTGFEADFGEAWFVGSLSLWFGRMAYTLPYIQ